MLNDISNDRNNHIGEDNKNKEAASSTASFYR